MELWEFKSQVHSTLLYYTMHNNYFSFGIAYDIFLFTLGVYYIYAQINYLDEHDVNAFQILHNDDPLLLCTTMTNTGRSHTISKANTCYTGYTTIIPLIHFSFESNYRETICSYLYATDVLGVDNFKLIL